MRAILPGSPGALAAILVEIGFRAFREVVFPGDIEARPRLIEARRIAGAVMPAVRCRVEADVPSPLLGVHRQARLDSDGSDLHVTIIDVSSVGAAGVRAAGEGGHGLLKRGWPAPANYQYVVGRNAIDPQRVVSPVRRGIGTDCSGFGSYCVPEVHMDRETKREFLIMVLSATSAIPLAAAVVLALSY
jgi:hypothetical protein